MTEFGALWVCLVVMCLFEISVMPMTISVTSPVIIWRSHVSEQDKKNAFSKSILYLFLRHWSRCLWSRCFRHAAASSQTRARLFRCSGPFAPLCFLTVSLLSESSLCSTIVTESKGHLRESVWPVWASTTKIVFSWPSLHALQGRWRQHSDSGALFPAWTRYASDTYNAVCTCLDQKWTGSLQRNLACSIV